MQQEICSLTKATTSQDTKAYISPPAVSPTETSQTKIHAASPGGLYCPCNRLLAQGKLTWVSLMWPTPPSSWCLKWCRQESSVVAMSSLRGGFSPSPAAAVPGEERGEADVPALLTAFLRWVVLASRSTILEMKVLRKGAMVEGSCSLRTAEPSVRN